MTYIYKDYQIILNKLCKFGIDEKLHLLHQKGSVPCIDVQLWDKYKNQIDKIYIRTNKGKRFKIKAKVFDNVKQEINLGFGKQYYAEKEYWDIEDKFKKEKIAEQLPLINNNHKEITEEEFNKLFE